MPPLEPSTVADDALERALAELARALAVGLADAWRRLAQRPSAPTTTDSKPMYRSIGSGARPATRSWPRQRAPLLRRSGAIVDPELLRLEPALPMGDQPLVTPKLCTTDPSAKRRQAAR
jgi:hypothetical protein